MDIGGKLKDARLKKNLTQEQIAELLQVSRQTVSNWETGKTYPDIISVIQFSNICDISLDSLLKEETPVPDYLNYLEESTNTVKSKNKLSLVIMTAVYLGIWALSLLFFWVFHGKEDAAVYSIIVLWIVLPVTTFVLSVLLGTNTYLGRKKWFLPLAFGIMYMFVEYGTFSAANMIAFSKVNAPDFFMILIGAAISLLGMGLGAGGKALAQKRKKK